jgi:hypothetical protein
MSLAKNINPEHWKIADLTRPGFRINGRTVPDMVDRVSELSNSINIDNATVVLQLFDNCVYMAGGPGREKRLPSKDRSTYLPHRRQPGCRGGDYVLPFNNCWTVIL